MYVNGKTIKKITEVMRVRIFGEGGGGGGDQGGT